MLSKLKLYVERFHPALAFAYRTLRDAWTFQRQKPQVMPYGFKLMGNPAMQSGAFEPEETALIKSLLGGAEIFVDIGANVGFYTCLARALGKYTIAVEPLPQNLAYLYANLEANGWTDVEICPLGLAKLPGLAALYGGGTGASLVNGWAGASPLLRQLVPLSTLDIVLGQRFNGRRLLIKVDVEGAEYDLLQGASCTLTQSPAPVWIVEILLQENQPSGFNQNYVRTFEIFWEHGYQSWTANREHVAIAPADVERWVRQQRCESKCINYLFAKE